MIFILQYLLFFTFCHAVFGGEESLLLTKIEGEFQLTRPTNYDTTTKIWHFQTPKEGKTYRFCPDKTKAEKRILIKMEQVAPDIDTTETKICNDPIFANVAKVYNSDQIKHEDIWNDEATLTLYHAGYVLNKDSTKTKDVDSNAKNKIKPEYEPVINNHKFLVLIELFYNKNIDQAIGAQYILRSISFHHVINIDAHAKVDFKNPIQRIPPIFATVDSPKYLKHFEGVVEDKWLRMMSLDSERNPLSLLEFATYEHFPIPMWGQPCKIVVNYIAIWKIPKIMWLRVEIFARAVARHLGDLNVTAGRTGIMSLSDKEVIDSNGYKMPKYLWKTFQYHRGQNSYGIIVVLNANPFEKTKNNLCKEQISCEDNGWIISNDDYRQGEVYCCPMSNENIKNLEATHVTLKETPIFNLNTWPPTKNSIHEEHKRDVSLERYRIPAPIN